MGGLLFFVFVIAAVEVAALLAWRGIVRARREAAYRGTIILLTLVAVSFWFIVSWFMLNILLATVMGDPAHLTVSARTIPEEWPIYASAGYLGLGAWLVWGLNRFPAKLTAL